MIVEDGTGLIDADSFVDIAYSDDYFSARGVTSWETLTLSEKEILLVKATDYIDNVFDWLGKKSTPEQSLNFPRIELYTKDGYAVDGIPKQLKDCVCECALILSQNKTLFKTENENGAVTSEHIGSLSFTYDVSQKITDSTLYESINTRLRGLYRDTTKKRIVSAEVRRKL